MIAEIYGKISSRGANLSETLEDNLTGNVFGNLRYIPFSKGIKSILLLAIDEKNFDKNELEEWSERIEFWPYHKEGELDLIINLNLVTIAIEVKYNSDLSSDDEVSSEENNNAIKPSRNQLARESRIIKEFAKARDTTPILLFIARENKGEEIINNIRERDIIEDDVILKFISWEDICTSLEGLSKSVELGYFEKVVIEDINKLLIRKDFNRFKDFKANIDQNIVIEDKYYVFEDNEVNDSSLNKESNKKISFISNINIREGEYYEFI